MKKHIKTSYTEFIRESQDFSAAINDLKKRAGKWSPKPLAAIINDKICVFRDTLRDIFHAANVKYNAADVKSQSDGHDFENRLTFMTDKEGGFSEAEFHKLEGIFKEFYGQGGFVDMVLGEDGREIILEFDSKYPMSLYSNFPSGSSHPQGGTSWNPHF